VIVPLRSQHAAGGFALGVIGTACGILGWWFAIRLLGSVFKDEKASPMAGCLTVAFLFLKLPLILLAWRATDLMGPPAPQFFLYGLALVYSATIHWALSQR
jgi:hypothetical protein